MTYALVAFSVWIVHLVLVAFARAKRDALPIRANAILGVAVVLGAGCSGSTANGNVTHDVAIGIALATCACAVWTDLACGLIFDIVTLPSIVVLLALSLPNVLTHALSALLAGGSLLALYAITQGRGLGLGDVKLAVVFGLAMFPTASAVAIGSAFVLGAIVCTGLVIVRRLDRRAAVPFAPFLSSGAALAFVVGAHA